MYVRYTSFVERLQELLREAKRPWVLLNGSEDEKFMEERGDFEELAWQEWKDLVEDRPGCWAVDDACVVGDGA